MQPVVILGDAAVAQPAVAAGEPGDGAFDHGSVLAIFDQPVWVTRRLAGGALPRIMRTYLEAFARAAVGTSGPRRATGAGRKPSVRSLPKLLLPRGNRWPPPSGKRRTR